MTSPYKVFGIHAVQAVLNKPNRSIRKLMILKDRIDAKIKNIIELAKIQQIPICFETKNTLDELSDHQNHQGVMAFCEASKTLSEADLASLLTHLSVPPFLLILDGIQDPHNLGACLRSADAAGVHAVIAPKDKSAGLTAAVSKVASGAAESVPFIQVTNLARTMRFLKEQNIWLFGATATAHQTLYEADLTASIAIVMGAEGSGLRRLTAENCDFLLNIPMLGTVSSLNVSVATGVFLFEAVRQRR